MGAKRFTREEDGLIVKTVKRNPENISKAFVLLSRKLQRSKYSIKQRYYKYLVKDPSNKLFLTVSSSKKYTNYKIRRKGMKAKPEVNQKSKWQRIIEILFGE